MVQGETKFFLQTVHRGLYKARSRISGKQRQLPDLIANDYAALKLYMQDPERALRERKAVAQPPQQKIPTQTKTK
jgi:hypothetical protein